MSKITLTDYIPRHWRASDCLRYVDFGSGKRIDGFPLIVKNKGYRKDWSKWPPKRVTVTVEVED